jgi:hypothetical protein
MNTIARAKYDLFIMGVARIVKGGRILKNPGFSRSISKDFFLCSGFSRSISKIFPKGVVRTPEPPGDAYVMYMQMNNTMETNNSPLE